MTLLYFIARVLCSVDQDNFAVLLLDDSEASILFSGNFVGLWEFARIHPELIIDDENVLSIYTDHVTIWVQKIYSIMTND